jgi:hypothetical protein
LKSIFFYSNDFYLRCEIDDYMAVIRCTPINALCKLSPDIARGAYPPHMAREEFPFIFKYLCLQCTQRSIKTLSLQPLLALRYLTSLTKPRKIISWVEVAL